MGKKVKRIDKAVLREIRSWMAEVLDDASAEFGVSLKLGRATYTDSNAKFALNVALVGDDGVVMTREAEEMRRMGHLYLPGRKLGDVFTFNGDDFRIIGYASRRPKYPVCAERVEDGKRFKFPAAAVETTL